MKHTVASGGVAASSWFGLGKGVARTGNAQNENTSSGVFTFRNMKPLSPISVLSLCVALASAALLSGCGEDSPTTSAPPPAVSSKVPSGWTHKENFPVGVGVAADYVDAAPPKNGFSANVLVITTPASGISAAQAMEMEISGLRSTSDISGVSVDSNSVVVIGGKSGQRGQFRFTKTNGGSVHQLLVREFLVVSNGKDIQIVLTREQDDSAAAAAFREVEASIVLN